MPRMAEIHIQKIDPTPPMEIAVAIPATFPVPTWAATAVARAWKELTLDLPSRPSSLHSRAEGILHRQIEVADLWETEVDGVEDADAEEGVRIRKLFQRIPLNSLTNPNTSMCCEFCELVLEVL